LKNRTLKVWMRILSKRMAKFRFRNLPLQLKVVSSFAAIVLIIALGGIYNVVKVDQIQQQFILQNAKVDKKLMATQLKQLAQQLDGMGSGLAISGNRTIIEAYDPVKETFLALVKEVGENATTREQRKWKASMTTTAGEFTENFNHIVQILDDASNTEEQRAAKLKLRYTMSQAHKTYIFELTDQFYQVFSEEADMAVQASTVLLEETIRVLLIAIGLVFVISIIVAVLFLRSFIGPIRRLQFAVQAVADGDLRMKVDSNTTDELGLLSRSFDGMTAQMTEILSASHTIASSMKQLSASFGNEVQMTASAGADIVKAMNEISSGADQQAMQAELSMTGVTELEEHVLEIKSITDKMKQVSIETSTHTEHGAQSVLILNQAAQQTELQMQHMADSLEALAVNTKQISQISSAIEEISNQTNILAVNATIEAAHAGEYGKGFAVIASRVRALSDETKSSSRHINQLIEALGSQMAYVQQDLIATVNQMHTQNNAITQTSSSFNIIEQSTEQLTVNMELIFAKVGDAMVKNHAVIQSFQHVLSIAEETAAGVQEVNSATTEQDRVIRQIADQAVMVNELSEQLFAQINRFKIRE
jgi:methyl-accepting chemotaxis protein